MEPWQKQFILSRLETLAPVTTCSTNLLSTLKAKYILDKDDIDRLDMIRNEFGETEQVNAFYAIIMSRTGAYVLLIEALVEFNQHIPAKILGEAYAANNVPCPLMPKKSDHSAQTNKPIQSITFTRRIFVQGKETTLQSFFQRFTKPTSEPYLSQFLDSESRRLINTSTFNLITVKIPPLATKYSYMPRTVFQHIFLKPTVISVPNSIFVLQGISKDELHQFVCDADIYTYSATRNIILSTDISAIIILVDENEMVDFNYVRKHTSGTPSIHHLSWDGTHFRWHQSSSGVGALAAHYSETKKEITETDFLKELISSPGKPVCLSGSPGSGKSVFMRQIAYHLLDNSEDLVFYFQFTEFLQLLPQSIDDITTNAIKNALAATHTSIPFAHEVLADVLDNNTNEVTLLLDEYDRVHTNLRTTAFKAIQVIREDMRNIRLITSARSGLSRDLECCLDTFCITLSPLSHQQKLDLVANVWEKNLSEFSRSEQIEKFASRCLSVMDNIRCKGQESNSDEDIATPLYCECLAELNLSNAAGFIDSDFLDEELTQVSSIHDLMHRAIQSRFLNVGETHLSHSISAIPVETVKEVHILASIAVLFPTYLKTFESMLGFSHKKYLHLKSVLSPGILTKNTLTGEIFFSSTIFAQYLIAEFITEAIKEQNFYKSPQTVEHVMNFLLKEVLCCNKKPVRALKQIKTLNNFDCNGISTFENIDIVRIMDWFLLQHDLRKTLGKINLDVVNNAFQNHVVAILEASASDSLFGVATLFLEALLQNNVQISIPNSLLKTSAMLSSYQYNQLLNNYIGNGNINVTGADSGISPLQAVVQRGDYNVFKEIIRNTACKMEHDLLHRCVKGSNGNPDRVIADKIKIINELLGMENTAGIISERVDGITPILQSGIHLQLLEHLLDNGADVNDITEIGETILDVYLVKGMNTKVTTQDLNIFLQLINSHGFNWKANRNSDLEPLLCVAFDRAVLNVESLRYFTDGGFDILSKNAAGENAVFVAIKKHQGIDILEHLISLAYEHMDWHTDLNLAGETILHVAVEAEHTSAVKFLLTAINSSKNITNLPRNDGNTALHLNLQQKSSSAEQILHMLMQAGANLTATNILNLTPLELGLQSGNFTMITKSLIQKLQNEYKYDLRHNAEKLLASILTRIDTNTILSTAPADREVFQYIMEEWEKTQSIIVFDSFNVNYNGITKRLDNILSNAEMKELLKYVFQNLNTFLEFWRLVQSRQPTIVLLKQDIPLPPPFYQNRTVRLNDNNTASKHPGQILTEDQLVQKLDENNNDIIGIISDSVGVTSFIHSISRKIQMKCMDNMGIYIDPSKFPRTWQRDNKTLLEYISERIAASPLSAKLLQMIFQNDTRIDIYVDGSRFQDIFVTSLQEEFLAEAAATIKFARIFVASCVPLKMTQLNPLKTPLQIEVMEFNMENLTSLITNIWNTNSVSNNPSLAEVQAKQYLDCIQLALNYDISTISQYILYINHAQEIAKPCGVEDNDIFHFVFRSLQHIATMENGEPKSFKHSMAVKETNFPGTFSATQKSFIGYMGDKYTLAKALFNSVPLNPDTKSDIEKYQDLFETVEGTSFSNPTDLGHFLPTFRLAFSPIRTLLFRNYTVLIFLDAMLVSKEFSRKIDCLKISNFSDHSVYEIIMACILLRLDGLLNALLLQLIKKNATDDNTQIFGQNPLSHLMIVAAKYSSSITIEKIIATFPPISQPFTKPMLGDELTPLHVAAQTGNAEGFICFHKNLNASNNTTFTLHTLLFNTWSDTDYIINEKLKILYFLLETNPSVCSETYDGIKPIFVGGVHVDLLLSLLKNATKSELKSLWEQNFIHYTASYMPSTQFDKMLEFTAAVADINKVLSTYDQFGQTPIHYALKRMHPVSMKTLELCLNNPDFEPFSYAKHTRNSLLFVDMSHQPDQVQNFVIEKGVNFFISCAERETLLDAVTTFGNAQIVSAIWNHPKMDVLNGRKYGNSPLHLAALYYKANEFHQCVEEVVLKRRIDKLYLRNEDGYTPLHLAVTRMEVNIKTIDLIICTGTPIYTLAKDNRTILETAYDKKRAETFIRSLKTRLELSQINPRVNIHAQSMELSVLRSNELEQVLKQYLKKNKSVLADITPVDLEFVSCLRTGNMFGKGNVAKLERAWTIHERSKLIYEILVKEPTLYGPFVEAVSLHCLPSTVNHLIDAIPFSQILQLRLNFHGHVHSLRELWLGMETQMWIALKQKLKINQVASIARISLSEGTTIKVAKGSVLPSLGLYKSRTLSRQIIVPQTFFTADSQNLFFFRGISLRELGKMAVINSFAMSSTQIRRVTTNFTYLEKDSHWTKISRTSNRPSYLCRYSKSLNAFVIEEIRNATDSFCQFSMGINTTGDNIITTTTREEELLSVMQLSCKSNIHSFGVVDLPGSGRSFLLRSLFEQIIIRSPHKLVGFIYLPLMIAEMVSKHKLQVDSTDDVRDSIVDYITTSRISAAFVSGLLEAGIIEIELFIDGLDDVADADSEFSRKLVSTILGIDNIRAFISLLPTTFIQHFKGKIAAVYRLHPFSETEQIDIFKHTHRKNTGVDTQLLDVQIQGLLRKTRVDFKCSELIGNPMRTRLVSEFITRGDLKHTLGTMSLLTSTYSACMGFVSSKDKDTNSFVEDNISSTGSDLSEPNKVADNKQNMILKIIAMYDSKFFNEYSAPHYNQDTANTSSNCNKFLPEGSIYEWIDLFNPTCKEYILSEFIKDSLEMFGEITAETKPIHYKIFDFFLHQLLETVHLDRETIETEPLTNELYCFRNPILAVFLNEQLNILYSKGKMHFELVSSCLRDMQPSMLNRLLIAISYHDLSSLMKFFKLSLDDLGAANLLMHKEYFMEIVKSEGSCEQTRAVCLISVACKHSSYALFSDLVATLDACFTVDVVTECLQTTQQQALNIAISLGKEQIVKIFLNRISKVDSRTLQSCVEYTTSDTNVVVSTKLRILKILLSLSDKTAIESSLAHKMIDLDIIKRLTLAGADPNYSDYTTSNVLVSAASYMSAEKFHDLIDFFDALGKLPSMLKGISGCPLHTILTTCISINIKDFSKLVDVAQDQARAIDHDGNNLLMVAARENKPVEFIHMLQDKGAVIDTKNISSKNALHFACEWGNIETIKYILSMGIPISSTTDDGKTCLHYASNSLETVLYLLNHGANISLRDKQQNNLLHFAAKEMANDNFNKLIEHVLENFPTIAVKLFNNKNQIQRTPILERVLSGKGMSFGVFRKLLCLEGLQINARDVEGNGIIHGIARNKYPVSFLKDALDKGIGYKNVNKKGNNVLHETVAAGNTEYIKVLLPIRQALYRRNVNEETPIEMAYNILKNAADPNKIVLYNDIIHLLTS